MLERQREGIAKAKSEGRYKGRKPTARAKAKQIEALAATGASMGAIANPTRHRKGIGAPRSEASQPGHWQALCLAGYSCCPDRLAAANL